MVVIHIMNIPDDNIPSEEKPRNPAGFPVLGALYRRPAHGYDLCRGLRQQLGEVWRLQTSHIYALLAELETDGLVCHERINQDNRPSKKVFRLTDHGREIFLTWIRSPVRNVRDIRLEFLAKLHFAKLESPEAVAKLLEAQLAVFRSNATRMVEQRKTCKTDTERSALDYRLVMVWATVIWLLRLQSPDDSRLEEAG